jgi:hypothetical protein
MFDDFDVADEVVEVEWTNSHGETWVVYVNERDMILLSQEKGLSPEAYEEFDDGPNDALRELMDPNSELGWVESPDYTILEEIADHLTGPIDEDAFDEWMDEMEEDD